MTTPKFALTHMNMTDESSCQTPSHRDSSFEAQPPVRGISRKQRILEKDSRHLVKNVPRLQLPRLLDSDDDSSDLESSDFGGDSGWFGPESAPTKRRSSIKHYTLPLKEPAKRRSSITKYTVPLKETSKPSKQSSIEGNPIRRVLKNSKRTTKQSFQARVHDTLGKSSLHLHRNRMQCKNIVAPKAA